MTRFLSGGGPGNSDSIGDFNDSPVIRLLLQSLSVPLPSGRARIAFSFDSLLLSFVIARIAIPPHFSPRSPFLTFPTTMSEPESSTGNGAASSVDPRSALKKPFSQVDLEGHALPPSPAPSTPRTGRRYALATELVFTEGNDQFKSSSVPIYQVGIGLFRASIRGSGGDYGS